MDRTAPNTVELGSPWPARVVAWLVDAALIAVVVRVVPGIDLTLDDSLPGLVVLALGYGLLVQFVRPLLNLLLLPYLVQSYGLVLIIVDVALFALLVAIFGGAFDVQDLFAVPVAGVALGLLRLAADGVFGLSPPVVPTSQAAARRMRLPSSIGGDRFRLIRIRRAVFRHGLDALFGVGVVGSIRRRCQTLLWRPSTPLEPLEPAVRFRLLLQDLGPTFVKVGQIISSRARALPPSWQVELEALQSDAPPYDYEHVRERITRELGAPPETLYATFDPEPLAAASLAQVHRARLHSGEEVAVKVQRPNIQRQLESDIQLLSSIATALASRARWADEIDLAGTVLEFGSALGRELDYTIEAYNARRLARVLERVDGVRVPWVHHPLSSSGVLTLEFVRGVKATNRREIVDAGLSPPRLADCVIRAAVQMMVIEGFFHADPHPGNVFVDLDNGDLTLLDTGMVGELSLQQRAKLAGFALAVRDGDLTGIAQSLKSLAQPIREVDDRRYYEQFVRRLGPYLDPPPGERVDVTGKVLPTGLAVLRDAGYRIDSEFTLAIKAVTQAEALTTALVPEWSGTEFMERALAAGEELLTDELTTDRVRQIATEQAAFVGRELLQELPSLQRGARRWLLGLSEGAVTVKVDTSALDDQVGVVRQISRTITLGVILAGLVVGSAIAAGIGGLEGSVLQPVTGLAVVVFTISSVVGVAALLVGAASLLRRRQEPTRGP